MEEVRRTVPGVHTPSKPERLGDGTTEFLRLDDLRVVGHSFLAHFYFKGGGLVQVTLSLNGKNSFDTTVGVFRLLSEPLRAKYGREVSSEDKRSPLNVVQSTWMSGRTNISVLTMGIDPQDALLNVNYQTRIATEIDKL